MVTIVQKNVYVKMTPCVTTSMDSVNVSQDGMEQNVKKNAKILGDLIVNSNFLVQPIIPLKQTT